MYFSSNFLLQRSSSITLLYSVGKEIYIPFTKMTAHFRSETSEYQENEDFDFSSPGDTQMVSETFHGSLVFNYPADHCGVVHG